MSLKAASELTGQPRAELRHRIAAGTLTARTIRRGQEVELRLTRAALAEAGLIGAPPPIPHVSSSEAPAIAPLGPTTHEPGPETLAQLIGLIREQNLRIASLEDQRAQLAARLGATVEAMHQLEDRLEAILDPLMTKPLAPAQRGAATPNPMTTDDGVVLTAASSAPAAPPPDDPTVQLVVGVRRSLARLVREVAYPRLRELGGDHRQQAAGD